MEIMHREIRRGGNITDQIMLGKAPWKNLFEKHCFFTNGYKYYLSVTSASTTKEAQLGWSGLVEAKIRLLVSGLEQHASIALAHPYVKGFDREHKCTTDEEIEKAKSGSLEFLVKDLSIETNTNGGAVVNDESLNGDKNPEEDKSTMIYTTTFYIGLELHEGKFPRFSNSPYFEAAYLLHRDKERVSPNGPPEFASTAHLLIFLGAKSLDLAWQVGDFRNKCTVWDKYDNELNALNVTHTRK
jgi:poly(A) polymerase